MPKKNNRPKQDVKNILHIFCEGEKTEPNYINGYLVRFFPTNRLLKVIEIEPTKKNTPKQLVEEAVKMQKICPEGDAFWVVYDRESKHKYPDSIHAEAYKKAKNHNISVALSNVCFEMWLLLHFQDSAAPYSCYDNLRDKSVLRDECKKRGIADYDKGDKELFGKITDDEINAARARAKKINMESEKSASLSESQPFHLNPYTDFYLLLDAIDGVNPKSKKT